MEFWRFVGVVFLVCFSLFSCSTQGYRFHVGGRDGWVVSPSENYNDWAERNRFQVNDTLEFKYSKGSDSVLEVNKDDFFNCNTNNPILKLDGGNSEFTFNQSGPYYFISGQNGNCAKGQKLFIIVMAVRHHKQPSPPPAMPPSAAPSPSTPVGPKPPSPSPEVSNPPAGSPAPSSSPSMSPVPAPSTGTTPPATSPATPPTLSPPSPTPVGPTPPTPSAEPPAPSPPGTVVTAPPPGSENSTAPTPPGSGGVRASSSVLVSWAVVLVSVALMSSFVQAGAV